LETTMNAAQIREIAERVLRPELEAFGLERIVVKEGLDNSDDPALFVDAFLRAGSPPLRGELSSHVHHALSKSLLEAGENRFPYLRVRHPDDEELADDFSPEGQ
jgi:hypothetical protein